MTSSPLDDVALPTALPARIGDLLASAACSSQTGGAVLILQQGEVLGIVARHGAIAATWALPVALAPALLASDLYAERAGAAGTGVWLEENSAIGFLASVPVQRDGVRIGALVVLHDALHALSGAAEYVLRTLATEIADQLELQDRRHAEAAFRSQQDAKEERLRLLESVVVNANDAVLITEAEPVDLPGPRIVYANAAFTRTTGYTLEDVLGKTPRILQGADTEMSSRQRLKKALKRWKPIELELLNYRKDGTQFWVELSIVPVADEKGWFTHWVSVQRDITERKRNEENAMQLRLAEAHNMALAQEVQERKRVEAELAFTAFHDDLTGLRNRAFFMDKLKSTVECAQRRPPCSSGIIFLDLDNFKLVNDSLGHSIGDLLLVEVAKRLKSCARPGDTISRIGGDEFTILCENLDSPRDIIAIAERLLERLNVPVKLANLEVVAGVSMGISYGAYTDAEYILRDADLAMYRAKKEGGARYALFDEEMHAGAKAAMRTRLELRSAIEGNQLEVFYQPIIDTVRGYTCALEALVRWRHPERGLVPPLEFIGIAEETGLIVELGSWVLHEVCRHSKIWKDTLDLPPNFRVNVNVSSRQLEDPGFLDALQSAMAGSGTNPSQLELEITESVFLRNADRMGALLNRIRSLGVRIAFDDFGTGYSSLSYLERYPIDTLKIDQSFVKRLITGHANADIVRMIVGLAKSLGVAVSAEGVEDVRQRDALKDFGCTVVQGYLYSRPVPFDEITHRLALEEGAAPGELGFERELEPVTM